MAEPAIDAHHHACAPDRFSMMRSTGCSREALAAGTPLASAFPARLARELGEVSHHKIEAAGAASRLRELIRFGGNAVEGPLRRPRFHHPFTQPRCRRDRHHIGRRLPQRSASDPGGHRAGRREAIAGYTRWSPVINIENHQCGSLAVKALMKEDGIIDCEVRRHLWPCMQPATRVMLIEAAKRLGVLALRWVA